jgi:hypothetical protein
MAQKRPAEDLERGANSFVYLFLELDIIKCFRITDKKTGRFESINGMGLVYKLFGSLGFLHFLFKRPASSQPDPVEISWGMTCRKALGLALRMGMFAVAATLAADGKRR